MNPTDTENQLRHTAALPRRSKLVYSFGALSDVIMANIIFQLSGPIYVQGLHVDPVLIGLAVSIPRLWDAFTDPVMGHISDNCRLRWGRRKPFMLLGAMLAGLFCVAMWMPPASWSEKGLFAYFLVISILFFTSYTIFSVPFNALGYELSDDYDERTSVMSYKTFMMNVGSAFLLPWALKLCMLDRFGGDKVTGARYVGVLFAVAIILAAIIPSVFCKERLRSASQPKIKLLDAFRHTFTNKTFLLLNVIVLTTLVGVFLAFPLLYYLNMAYICPADDSLTATMTGWYGTVYGISGILGVPVINYLGRRLGKKKALMSGLAVIIIGFLASWKLFTPAMPSLQLVFAVLASPSLSCVFILTSSMMADVCDIDEVKTGLRREGMYGAVFGFLVKLGLAGVLALSGFILNWTGYDAARQYQSETTIGMLRLFFVFLPIGFLVISLLCTLRFPLSRKVIESIRLELDSRASQT